MNDLSSELSGVFLTSYKLRGGEEVIGWGYPLTILSGLIALLCLACSIALSDTRQSDKLVLMLATGGLAATALYGITLVIQLMLAVIQLSIHSA